MKVRTLPQPHATLVALGIQAILTEDAALPESLIGQRIAIHAAKRRSEFDLIRDQWGRWEMRPLAPGRKIPGRVVVWDQQDGLGHTCEQTPLPLGCIVATAVLDDCVPMVDGDSVGIYAQSARLGVRSDGALWLTRQQPDGEWWYYPVHDQLPYGDFRPGRFAWLLRDVEPVTETCPACRGGGMIYTGPTQQLDRPCLTCKATGRCDPIPFKGGQGLSREWTP